MLIVIIILLIFIVALICKVIKLRLVFSLQFTSDERSIELSILLFSNKFLSYKFNLIKKDQHFQINFIKKGKLATVYTVKEILNQLRNIFHQYKKSFDFVENDVNKKLRFFFNKNIVAVEGLNAQVGLGFRDAAATALIHGVLLAIINALIGRLYDPKRRPKEFCVNLTPIFNKAALEVNLNFIICIRLSSAAAIGGALVFLFLRNKIKKEKTVYEKQNNKKNHNPF